MEIRDLYNKKKELTGEFIEKGQPVPNSRYYLTVIVWIQNSKGEFLLQKTVPSKKHKWSTTGGHPVSGESSLQGIVTEIKEELGLDVESDELHLIKTIKTEDDFVDVYYIKKDINIKDITIQPEEVEDVIWASKNQIEELIEQGEFLSNHIEFYKCCNQYLQEK